MVAPNAKELLKNENELLEKLAQTASTFAQNLAGVQSDVLNDWAAYFRGWQRINQGLISGSDSALDQELNAEVKRLEGMRDSISGENASDTYWRQVLNEDIEDAKRLLS